MPWRSIRWRPVGHGAALLVALVLAGCNSGPNIVKVSGTVTRGGKALPGVELFFEPDQGRQSTAITDDQGRFTLHYDQHQEGAVKGHHKVHVRLVRAPLAAEDREAVRAKYGDRDHPNLEYTLDKDTTDLEIKLD